MMMRKRRRRESVGGHRYGYEDTEIGMEHLALTDVHACVRGSGILFCLSVCLAEALSAGFSVDIR